MNGPDLSQRQRAMAMQSSSAPSVTVEASLSCASAEIIPRESGSAAREYTQAVLELYLSLPGTPGVTSRYDRRFARELFRRGIPLAVIRNAIVLAVARRTFRGGDPLPRIRALAYFGPAVEEILELPPDPGYVRHLEDKLRRLAERA